MSTNAPIALFAYKRPLHLKKTLESLSNCAGASESELFIFCDGARAEMDSKDVMEARRIAKSRKWCGVNNVIEQDKNLGLAKSIISGVTELCAKYGRVIVIEDDLLVSRFFLSYMNRALDFYENKERVMQISGHMFPVELKAETDAIFLPFASSWGWATWGRAWAHFDGEMKDYHKLEDDAKLRKRFDLDGAYPFFKMLRSQHEGSIDSWAIRWYLSVFMRGGLTLFPRKTLVENTGFDGSGTHCDSSEKSLTEPLKDFNVVNFPKDIEVSDSDFCHVRDFLGKQKRSENSLGAFISRLLGY
jgi:hypothetical protein